MLFRKLNRSKLQQSKISMIVCDHRKHRSCRCENWAIYEEQAVNKLSSQGH